MCRSEKGVGAKQRWRCFDGVLLGKCRFCAQKRFVLVKNSKNISIFGLLLIVFYRKYVIL